MSKIDNGGNAFPVEFDHHIFNCSDEEVKSLMTGMSLRDYFAAKALGGIVGKINLEFIDVDEDVTIYDEVARGAYSYADAMIKARKGSK